LNFSLQLVIFKLSKGNIKTNTNGYGGDVSGSDDEVGIYSKKIQNSINKIKDSHYSNPSMGE